MSQETYPADTVRLLIIDDEPAVREALAHALMKQGGYEVHAAGDPFEAGFMFARLRPQLVIVDLVMPAVGGFDLCAQMRRLSNGDNDVKIIVLTGYVSDGTGEQSVLAGADLLLEKPVDLSTLLTHVRELLDEDA